MKFKKILFGLLTLTCSAVGAGGMGAEPVCNKVKLPCAKTGWHFEVDGLYFKPAYTSGFYLTSFTNSNNTQNFHEPDPNWSWGFKGGAGYHFGEGNDLTFSWYHHEKNQEWSRQVGTALFNQVFSFSFKNKWDALNLDLGQLADYGPKKSIRYYGGLQYARIHNQFSLALQNNNALNNFSVAFDGIGPRTGMDYEFHWNGQWSIFAKGAAGLLVGKKDFSNGTAGILAAVGSASGSSDAIVPELDGQLGVQYVYSATQGDYIVKLGYLWANYFNALSIRTTAGNLNRNSDFGLQGAYLGLRYFGYT